MSVDLVLRAPRAVVDGEERAVAVVVDAGRTVAVEGLDAAVPARREVRLGDDEVLLPGLVDTHVHVNEPGRTDWEGFATATRAAAAGGVTTVVDMPLNSIPPTTTVAALRSKQDAARDQVHVDVGFWGGAVPGNLGDLGALHEAGVFGFKCFLVDSGVEEFPPLTPDGLAAALERTSALGALLVVHAEDADQIERAPSAEGRAYGAFLASRPASAEDAAIARVVAELRRSGGRAHVLHLSSGTGVDVVRAARREGLDLSAETCPHYLCLAAEDVPDGATVYKCCPPVREAAHRERLWSGLLDGDIGLVVTDHSPCPPELKRPDTGDFGQAWGGIASLQVGLAAVWTQARSRGIALADVVRWMSTAPADRVGLTGKGRIAAGADADFAVLAPEDELVVDPAALHHRHPVSAWAGRRLVGRVRSTWLRGEPVDLADAPRGRLLERGRR